MKCTVPNCRWKWRRHAAFGLSHGGKAAACLSLIVVYVPLRRQAGPRLETHLIA